MGSYEPEMTAYLLGKFQPDTIFLDVGAREGYYTVLAAPLVKSVVAFEPNLVQLGRLEGRIIKYTNVVVYPLALFSRPLRGMMDVKDRGIFHINREGEPQVEAVTLDSLNLTPSVIKIDIEGAELDALMGAKETLLAYKPILAIEVHSRRIRKYFGHEPEQVTLFLESLGYTVSHLHSIRICAEWVS